MTEEMVKMEKIGRKVNPPHVKLTGADNQKASYPTVKVEIAILVAVAAAVVIYFIWYGVYISATPPCYTWTALSPDDKAIKIESEASGIQNVWICDKKLIDKKKEPLQRTWTIDY